MTLTVMDWLDGVSVRDVHAFVWFMMIAYLRNYRCCTRSMREQAMGENIG